MSRLLITNCGAVDGGVYLLDPVTGGVERIHEGVARGITYGPDGNLYFVESGGGLYRLNPETWRPTLLKELDEKGCHDLRWYDNSFYLVACMGNRVLRLDPDFNTTGVLTLIDDPADVCHANCLIRRGDDLLLTIFTLAPGPRAEKNQSDAWRYEGKVLKLDWERGGFEVAYEPLAQPHSLVWRDDRLYCCESLTSLLVAISGCGEGPAEKLKLARLHGFVRGLVFHEGNAYVGISQLRTKVVTLSHRLQRWQKLACGVLELDPETWRVKREWPIPGTEVYEILPVAE